MFQGIKPYTILLCVFSFWTNAQISDYTKKYQDSLNEVDEQYEHMLHVIEQSLLQFHEDARPKSNYDSIVKVLNYSVDSVPAFSDSVYCARLTHLNERSPFHLDCNQYVLNTIDFFSRKRRDFTRITIGRSALYFPMYEEKLAKHDMPLELKYLSVIESGLRPQVRSRAGAMGLWQFMFRTGKMFGLEETSYIDERMDPEKATEAACLYLKQLYGMYNDWNMALAAYNAGPGNVNKAIRRSGGKMTYWEIRPFLPKETQGYVPNFIAMAYMMNFYAEHNIQPLPPIVNDFELDTICLKASLHMETIDSVLKWSVEDIKYVNPIYKTNYIPFTEPNQCINIPVTLVRQWIALEDSIYRLDSLLYHSVNQAEKLTADSTPKVESASIHVVQKGENLSIIARKYGTTVAKLMSLNNMKSTNLSIGQKLRVKGLKHFGYGNQLETSVESRKKKQRIRPRILYRLRSKG